LIERTILKARGEIDQGKILEPPSVTIAMKEEHVRVQMTLGIKFFI
jgi:hypothetical protein